MRQLVRREIKINIKKEYQRVLVAYYFEIIQVAKSKCSIHKEEQLKIANFLHSQLEPNFNISLHAKKYPHSLSYIKIFDVLPDAQVKNIKSRFEKKLYFLRKDLLSTGAIDINGEETRILFGFGSSIVSGRAYEAMEKAKIKYVQDEEVIKQVHKNVY